MFEELESFMLPPLPLEDGFFQKGYDTELNSLGLKPEKQESY